MGTGPNALVVILTEPERFSESESSLLSAKGYHLTRVVDLEETVRTVTEDRPDLVVFDGNVLPSDKLLLAQRLREVRDSTPILLNIRVAGVIPVGHAPSASFDEEVPGPLDGAGISSVCEWALARHRRFATVVSSYNQFITSLVDDATCEWVRTTSGIVGVVRVSDRDPTQMLDSCVHAYSLLDGLPEGRLSFDDLWNVLLFVSIPWTTEECSADSPLADSVEAVRRDTNGSRKLILFKPMSPMEFIGDFTAANSWLPSVGEPLREELAELARDEEERRALDVLFQRRISDEDVDRLIRALSRATDGD